MSENHELEHKHHDEHTAGEPHTEHDAHEHPRHAAHDHGHKHGGESTLLWPLLLTATFAIIELVGGLYTGSLGIAG